MRVPVFIVISVIAFSCNPKNDRKESRIDGDSISIKKNLEVLDDTLKHKEGQTKIFDCSRGQAEPIILRSIFPGTTFYLQEDSISGIETVGLDNGDKLIINNSGCEYYVLKFRFETSRFQKDTSDLKFWFEQSGLLMGEIVTGIDAPIDIREGIKALSHYIDANTDQLKLGEEIDFGGEEMREFVTVDRIQKISGKEFGVEVSFALGPL